MSCIVDVLNMKINVQVRLKIILKSFCNIYTPAELMLAELIVLMYAELYDRLGSDIIEHKLYCKSVIFDMALPNLAWITKGKANKRHAAATDDL